MIYPYTTIDIGMCYDDSYLVICQIHRIILGSRPSTISLNHFASGTKEV